MIRLDFDIKESNISIYLQISAQQEIDQDKKLLLKKSLALIQVLITN